MTKEDNVRFIYIEFVFIQRLSLERKLVVKKKKLSFEFHWSKTIK